MLAQPVERARALFAEGRYSAALAVFGGAVPDDAHLALSCAEALGEVGRHEDALSVASRVEAKHAANAALVAASLRVSGAIILDRGDRTAGSERLKAAMGLAEASGDSAEAARAALRLFTLVHSSSGRARSAEVLAAAKRLVLRSNQLSLLADLHSRVGQAEAQSGNLQAAQRHLNRSVELLTERPHQRRNCQNSTRVVLNPGAAVS